VGLTLFTIFQHSNVTILLYYAVEISIIVLLQQGVSNANPTVLNVLQLCFVPFVRQVLCKLAVCAIFAVLDRFTIHQLAYATIVWRTVVFVRHLRCAPPA
jgi:hypothetical protein